MSLTNQIGLAVPKIYHQLGCFTRMGLSCGGLSDFEELVWVTRIGRRCWF